MVDIFAGINFSDVGRQLGEMLLYLLPVIIAFAVGIAVADGIKDLLSGVFKKLRGR